MDHNLVLGTVGSDGGDDNDDDVAAAATSAASKNVTLHTWDFAGQAVYYETHHLFVTRGVYLLVFDMEDALRNTDGAVEALSFWLNSLHHQLGTTSRDFSIIMVGTHADCVPHRSDQERISAQLLDTLGECPARLACRHPAGRGHGHHDRTAQATAGGAAAAPLQQRRSGGGRRGRRAAAP